MLANIIGLGPISSLAGTWLQGRVDKAKAETEVKVAKAKAEAKVYETEATSSMLMNKLLQIKWVRVGRTNFGHLWFGAILVCCFLPWTQPYVKEGFIFLDQNTPNWFSNMLIYNNREFIWISLW